MSSASTNSIHKPSSQSVMQEGEMEMLEMGFEGEGRFKKGNSYQ